MQHELRRKDRGMSESEARELLERGEYGVLSLCGADNEPYGLPLSYCVLDNAIYFHCAVEGHKLTLLAANSRASFCVVGVTELLPEKFSTRYESVIISGQATEVLDTEKQRGLEGLVAKYSSSFMSEGLHYIDVQWQATRVFKLSIDAINGKARR
jgi:uncharacterized protein